MGAVIALCQLETTTCIESVVEQHAQEAAFLWLLRDAAVRGPHYSFPELAELDNRIEAHIDGLRVAGADGWSFCSRALAFEEPGEVFAAAVIALEGDDGQCVQRVADVACKSKPNFRGLISALGWVSPDHAQRWLPSLIGAQSPHHRALGLAALSINRLDPGSHLQDALSEPKLLLHGRTLRAVGELRHKKSLPQLHEHMRAANAECRFWSAWSAILIGDTAAAESLKSFVVFRSPMAYRAIQLVPRVLDAASSRDWLKALAREEVTRCMALVGCGVVGDPVYVPTLISQMSIPEFARVAGEAFSMIIGVDLAYEGLETDWPEGFEAGPTEDPADENVDLDPDEDLPWPDQALVQQWWDKHGGAYQLGTRYLCGRPITDENCRRVLVEGFQRQRIAAAYELALMNPDERLFEWRAPGFRQQEWLGLRKPRRRAS